MCVQGLSKCNPMATNYRQDEHGFYYGESANYNPTGYEFSASVNQFPVDAYVLCDWINNNNIYQMIVYHKLKLDLYHMC